MTDLADSVEESPARTAYKEKQRRNAEKAGFLSSDRAAHYTAFVLTAAFIRQRSLATIAKLTVGQFRGALQFDKPCIEVQSSQDKIKMQHYVP
ncbi:MAG: hypothetical protein WCI87_03045 [Euryarchaeota archaeon]